jgi:hypothetical protein
MSTQLITLLHGAVIVLLIVGTFGAFAASYSVWVVKCATPEGRAAQRLAAQRLQAAFAAMSPPPRRKSGDRRATEPLLQRSPLPRKSQKRV